MTFIFSHGRLAPGMCAPYNCPWVPSSPWSQPRKQQGSGAWRADQHRKLHYLQNQVAVHLTSEFVETFVYLNRLYFMRPVPDSLLAGFCAFSARYLNLYVFKYPRVNLNGSPDAEEHLEMCLDYLEKYRHVQKIADGWITTIRHASLLYEQATEKTVLGSRAKIGPILTLFLNLPTSSA
ncbi:hypothetical protein E4U56_008199 [Claviceps arundinis]|uniref:Uncharacterized protein n=1 Tax=Claviceps arundinis TaxID=1623583 RepID=A0A9P7MZ11_9HYPO|nr:hypothetical protein E4U56_008199 [Claviceps arundinis]